MAKNVYYRYNPETDNFERVYPSLKSRLAAIVKNGGVSLGLAALFFILIFYCFDSPTVENLRRENHQLRTQYGILNKRLDNSLKVLQHIQDRDENFYRVMMQMDPMSTTQKFSGLDREGRYRELEELTDAALVTKMAQSVDMLEHQISAQVQSFDQLRETMINQKEKMAHIPSVLPVRITDYSIAAGYGYRRDPVGGTIKFHDGIDFSAPIGASVFATADGVVKKAERTAGYGNCIDIDHGYNYLSRYAHLNEILVKTGEKVSRGQLIGRVGSTGKSTGSHLHYEVRFKDEPQNPVNYYFMDLSPEEYAEMIQMTENAGHVMD